MKNSYKILLGVATIAAIGTFIYIAQNHKNQASKRRSQQVADEGYEFAYDVLYPLKNKRYA